MLCCIRDSFFCQRGPDPGPGELESNLAVFEIDAGPSVIVGRRLAIHIAAPPPMRVAGRPQDPPNREIAPNHLVVILLAHAIDDAGTQGDGLQIVGHRLSEALYFSTQLIPWFSD